MPCYQWNASLQGSHHWLGTNDKSRWKTPSERWLQNYRPIWEQVAALGWTWTGLPWIPLIGTPQWYEQSLSGRKKHIHVSKPVNLEGGRCLCVTAVSPFSCHRTKGQVCAHSSILVTWVSFPATEPVFQTPYMMSTNAYLVLTYLHLLFCLIQCVSPKQ